MKKLLLAAVLSIILSACSMTWGVKDNPFVGNWDWNGGPWSFTCALTFVGPSSSGAYAFAITKYAPYHGVGTIGTVTISGKPQPYDFLIEDSLHIGLTHSTPNADPAKSPTIINDGVMLGQ